MTETVRSEIVAGGKRATSAWGFLAHPVVPFVGIFVAGVGVYDVLIGLAHAERDLVIFGGYDVACAGAAGVLAWLVARKRVERAVDREIAWLDALPFTISRHFDLLAKGDARVHVTFRSAHPSGQEWERMLAAASGEVLELRSRRSDGRICELACKTVPALPGGHRIWRAWHDIVEGHLVPMHARFPFESMRIER